MGAGLKGVTVDSLPVRRRERIGISSAPGRVVQIDGTYFEFLHTFSVRGIESL